MVITMKNKKQYGDWQKPSRNYELTFRLKSTKEQKEWIHQHLQVKDTLSIKNQENPKRIEVYAKDTLIGEIPQRLYEQIFETQPYVRRFEVSEIFYKGMVSVEAVEVLWSCTPEVRSTLDKIKLVPVNVKKLNTFSLVVDSLAIIIASILIIFNLSEPGTNLWVAIGILVISLISFAIHINQRS